MKNIFFLILCLLVLHGSAQFQSVDELKTKLVQDLKEYNDLRLYSHKAIPNEVSVNLIWVEEVKNLKVKGNTISMLVDHGKGKFCTSVSFEFTQVDGKYYLVFPEPYESELLGKDKTWVNPWVEKNTDCE